MPTLLFTLLPKRKSLTLSNTTSLLHNGIGHPAKRALPAKQPPVMDIEEFIKLFEQMSVKEGPRETVEKEIASESSKAHQAKEDVDATTEA